MKGVRSEATGREATRSPTAVWRRRPFLGLGCWGGSRATLAGTPSYSRTDPKIDMGVFLGLLRSGEAPKKGQGCSPYLGRQGVQETPALQARRREALEAPK